MLTEAGIDLDNLQIAAFVLDGHGGDERSDQVALWRRVWEAVAALPRGRFHRLPFLLNGGGPGGPLQQRGRDRPR